jgi:hypothetical protein
MKSNYKMLKFVWYAVNTNMITGTPPPYFNFTRPYIHTDMLQFDTIFWTQKKYIYNLCCLQAFWSQNNKQGTVAFSVARSEPVQFWLWGILKEKSVCLWSVHLS